VNKSLKNTKNTQNKPFFHRWLESVWYDNANGRFLLMPLSALFCFMSQRRRKQQEATQHSFPVPIIVIGNITVGGTGKTPLVIALTQHLQQQGYKPCIITRGYTGKAEKWPLAVTDKTDVSLSGDEAKLMALRTHVPVIASPKRLDAIRYVLKHYADKCDCILSDDGLQHYKMHRDMEIAVIDGQRQFGNGQCLPAGPLREKPSRLTQCDLVIVNGSPLTPYQHSLQISSHEWHSLDNTQRKPCTTLQQVQVYTAIGNPQRFVDHLSAKSITIAHCHFFPDHHHFTLADFATLDNTLPIVMTEKDAIKCQQLHLENAWYLPITVQLDNAFKIAFNSHFANIASRDTSYE